METELQKDKLLHAWKKLAWQNYASVYQLFRAMKRGGSADIFVQGKVAGIDISSDYLVHELTDLPYNYEGYAKQLLLHIHRLWLAVSSHCSTYVETVHLPEYPECVGLILRGGDDRHNIRYCPSGEAGHLDYWNTQLFINAYYDRSEISAKSQLEYRNNLGMAYFINDLARKLPDDQLAAVTADLVDIVVNQVGQSGEVPIFD